MTFYKRDDCRICGGKNLYKFLDLGPMPLANSFLTSPHQFETEVFFSLGVYFCNNCSLVQLLDVVDPGLLFRHYLYTTGVSDTIAKHNNRYARAVKELLNLKEDDLVVEVASNDGSLLKCFQSRKVKTLGVDPARNLAELACASGVHTLAEFFDLETSEAIRKKYGRAKAVVGNNVLAHVDNTTEFFLAMKNLITRDGLVIVEVPYLRYLLEGLEYDTIYHEHLCYFSVESLVRLCHRTGLCVFRIDPLTIHGGSLRIHAGLPEHYGDDNPVVSDWIQKERNIGMHNSERFDQFAKQVKNNRDDLRKLVFSLVKEGKTVFGYGASAKGTTLLNYCGFDNKTIPAILDKSPLKVNKFSPGTHIPVAPVSELLEKQPDYLLVLAWNFAEEIMAQQRKYQDRGGRFIIPMPELKIV